MAKRLDFDWVDAFTDRAFGGNGCAVVHGAGGLDDATCMAFTRETGLVECTFLEPTEVADMKIRYFLATKEIPFAGHPTIASVVSMVARGVVEPGDVTVETGAGVIPIEATDDEAPLVTMTQVAPTFGEVLDAELVAAVGGLSPDDIAAPPQMVSTGLPFCITLLKSKEALRRVQIDIAALERFRSALGGGAMADLIEPFWVTRGGATEAGDTFSRLVLAPPLPPEDPFTGSATGAMAAYLWHHGLIENPRFVAEQGHDMGRPGQANVEVLGPRDAITGLRVSGRGYVLMQGTLAL